MNSTFLILIALPLGLYLLILLFQTREIGADERSEEHTRDSADVLAQTSALEKLPEREMETERAVVVSDDAVLEISAPVAIESARVAVKEIAAEPVAETTLPAQENVPVVETPSVAENTPAASSAPTQPVELDTLDDEYEPILPEGPLEFPAKGSPKYTFDYRGRLWVEKKSKNFFRQLRRPQIPPEDPQTNSSR